MNQDLRKEMQSYSNERIINNIKQQASFSSRSVAIAREIALERKILSEAQIDKLAISGSTPTASKVYKADNSSGGIGVVGGIFIALFIVKTILRIAMYS